MLKKRIMIVGCRNSGKSSIANIINQVDKRLRKTQDVIYGRYTIDTPSAYLELPYNYKFLVALAQEANVLLCIIDATSPTIVYPPHFVESFNCKWVGVVTKVDLVCEHQIQLAKKQLNDIGIISSIILLGKNGNGFYKESIDKLVSLRSYCRV